MKKTGCFRRYFALILCFCTTLFTYASFHVDIKTSAAQIVCNSVDCIRNAMENASPGDEIVIAPGTYVNDEKVTTSDGIAARYYSSVDGTEANPITIRAQDPNNRPILKGPNGIYDGYVMRIQGGDYWIIKDLILEDGSKGLVLDDSSHSQLLNLKIQDIAQEAIHIRDGSSNVLIDSCEVCNVGVNDPGNGEAVYIGSDRKVHPQNVDSGDISFDPKCDNTIIQNCILGPNVRAEGVDVKEGTTNTIIRNCTFYATGISNQTSANAFIDLKGVLGFVYDNEFNVDGEPNLEAGVDVQNRDDVENTGYRNSIFNNTFNLGSGGADIPTVRLVRFKGTDPIETHSFDNIRNPDTPEPDILFKGQELFTNCPDWNVVPCGGILSVGEVDLLENITVYPNPMRDYLHIANPSGSLVAITVKTLWGQNIWSVSNVTKVQAIPMMAVAPGMYWVEIKTEDGITRTQKMLKN